MIYIHFYLTWFYWLSVLQNFTCYHQTYNYSRPWSALLGSLNHLLSCKTMPTQGHCPLNLAESPNLMGCTRSASTACMLTQSTQLGCSCAWVLAFTQMHKLVQFMLMQKPHKCYNEGWGLCPFEPCHEEETPPSSWTPHLYILAQKVRRNSGDFFQ